MSAKKTSTKGRKQGGKAIQIGGGPPGKIIRAQNSAQFNSKEKGRASWKD